MMVTLNTDERSFCSYPNNIHPHFVDSCFSPKGAPSGQKIPTCPFAEMSGLFGESERGKCAIGGVGGA